MKINREKLLEALEIASLVVGKKTTLQILNCVHFEAKEGRLNILASDLECTIRHGVECDGEIAAVCVPFKPLSVFTESVVGEAVEMDLNDMRLNCSCDLSKVSIGCLKAEEFPNIPNGKAKAAGVNSEDLAAGIDAVAWAAGNDASRYLLEAVHVVGTTKQIMCEAFQGRILAQFKKPAISAEFDLMLRHDAALKASKFLKFKDSTLLIGDRYIMIEYGNSCCFYAARVEGVYFETELVLSLDRREVGDLIKSEVSETILVCSHHDAFAFPVDFKFSKSGAHLSHQNDRFTFERTILGEYCDGSIRMDAKLLSSALRSVESERLSSFTTEQGFGFEAGDVTVLISGMQVR